MSTAPAVQIRGLEFGYGRKTPILEIPEFHLGRGERAILYGPSGSGKTTLLGLLAGILEPRAGSIEILGTDLGALRRSARDRFRGAHLGYIFQLFNLIPYLSVLDNITLPCRVHAERRARLGAIPLREAATRLAERLGIENDLAQEAGSLSVGQQQRVAAARALLGNPELIIADEPTSALDYDHRERFLELLFEECAGRGSALLFVSHDRGLQPFFSSVIALNELNRPGASL